MPRSRSWSIESMTRSVSSSCAANTPDWRSIASTSVVLPWSTWAMIATLRMSERCDMKLWGSSRPQIATLDGRVRARRISRSMQRRPTTASLDERSRRLLIGEDGLGLLERGRDHRQGGGGHRLLDQREQSRSSSRTWSASRRPSSRRSVTVASASSRTTSARWRIAT